jgi:hypothetical protein
VSREEKREEEKKGRGGGGLLISPPNLRKKLSPTRFSPFATLLLFLFASAMLVCQVTEREREEKRPSFVKKRNREQRKMS